MLVIRLFRVGKKHQPSFKIVVTDKRRPPRAGRFVEEVGFYNPLTKEKVLKAERIKYWLSAGAKPSATVYNLLISEKILEGKKIDVRKKSKKVAAPSPAPPSEAGIPEKPVEGKEVKETKSLLPPRSARELVKEKPAEEPKIESTEPAAETKKEEKAPKPPKVAEEKAKEEVKNE